MCKIPIDTSLEAGLEQVWWFEDGLRNENAYCRHELKWFETWFEGKFDQCGNTHKRINIFYYHYLN